jgi:hypothetical protein
MATRPPGPPNVSRPRGSSGIRTTRASRPRRPPRWTSGGRDRTITSQGPTGIHGDSFLVSSKIAKAYPSGTAPDLSISEYNLGCEADISGGVGQADLLGVFGREGVWAAAAWPLQALTDNYLLAAFDLYRNYDGNGAVVGDTGVYATTSDAVDTSVYAFAHSDDASALDLVVLNKTASARKATIHLNGAQDLTHAVAYHLVDGAAAVVSVPTSIPVACDAGACSFTYTMPPMSTTTVILRASNG